MYTSNTLAHNSIHKNESFDFFVRERWTFYIILRMNSYSYDKQYSMLAANAKWKFITHKHKRKIRMKQYPKSSTKIYCCLYISIRFRIQECNMLSISTFRLYSFTVFIRCLCVYQYFRKI